jgi:hypothetical protein
MQRILLCGCVAACLWACGGGGEVVAVKFVRTDAASNDANPNGYYLCPRAEGDPPTFSCQSGQQFHQYDRVVEAGSQCQYGIASIYVETSGGGQVTRLQYACALAPVSEFPAEPGAPAVPATGPAAPSVAASAVAAPAAAATAVVAPVSAVPTSGGR